MSCAHNSKSVLYIYRRFVQICRSSVNRSFEKMKLVAVLVLCVASVLTVPLNGALKRPTFLIVGGESTEIEEVPHQVSLEIFERYLCGGSIIGEDWVLTAAHCVEGLNESDLSIRSGSMIIEEGGVVSTVEEIIVHDLFDYDTMDYDIALIKVAKKFVFDSAVQKIALSEQKTPVGTAVTVSGWGKLAIFGTYPEILQRVDVNVVDFNECKEAHKKIKPVTDRMMCAGVLEGGQDSCDGDSGGPLFTDSPRVLVGIVSWGINCGLRGYPGVNTDVSVLRDWIKDKSGV